MFTFLKGEVLYGGIDRGMKTPVTNPVHWRLSLLLELGPEDVHDLARKVVGSLTSYRLVLGRCLLAMHQSKGYKRHGCSSAIHYACAILGMGGPSARECRRVADRLQGLPELTLAAELGTIEWGKLREIVRRAVPATESYWLALANRHSYKEIEHLVSRTPQGSVPGEVDTAGDSYRTELRCAASPELFAMVERLRRVLSLANDESVTTGQVLETAVACLMSSGTLSVEDLEKARVEADRDLLAEAARRQPIVASARELALEMGLLDECSDVSDSKCPARDISVVSTSEREVAKLEGDHSRSDFETVEPGEQNAVAGRTERLAECSVRYICGLDGAGAGERMADRPAASGSEHFSECPARDRSELAEAGERDVTAASGPDHFPKCPARDRSEFAETGERGITAASGPDHFPKCPARDTGELGETGERGITADAAAPLLESPVGDGRSCANTEPDWRNPKLRFNSQARHATKAQRNELLRRDGWCCRTPGCPNRVWLHLHHLHEYAQGGATSPDNLLCLCSGCHRNLHQGALKISESPDGKLLYTDSAGRRLDRQADLELASWLDAHLGWSGKELDSHAARLWQGDWTVFSS